MRAIAGLLLGWILFADTVSAGNAVVMKSGDTQVVLLELFTSQGCSSCPPAEAWINTLVDYERLWIDVVPVVFHVDYWDGLGWPDVYAAKSHTARQYRYKKGGNTSAVYTPGFMANGREWREWFDGRVLSIQPEGSGILEGTVTGNRLVAAYSGEENARTLHVAVLGFGLETHIRRGENQGRRLRQEFVVLAHESHDSADGRWQVALPDVTPYEPQRIGLALWVTGSDGMRPLQTTGGWLDGVGSGQSQPGRD